MLVTIKFLDSIFTVLCVTVRLSSETHCYESVVVEVHGFKLYEYVIKTNALFFKLKHVNLTFGRSV
jgi:hypothetical protein